MYVVVRIVEDFEIKERPGFKDFLIDMINYVGINNRKSVLHYPLNALRAQLFKDTVHYAVYNIVNWSNYMPGQ